jgi:hypothetical protein
MGANETEIKTGEITQGTEGWAKLRAAWIIDRWRKQGFDTMACAPSGYCSPMNSSVMRMRLPDTYHFYTLDSAEANEALERSIKAGNAYRF